MLDPLIYDPSLFVAERQLAEWLVTLRNAGCQKIEPVLDGLLHKQPQSVINACQHNVSILTGPAGTGKTTTTKRIVESFHKAGMRGMLLAPTGKASKRSKSVIGTDMNCDFATIHFGLEYFGFNNRFIRNRFNPLDCDYVIVDEFPMTGCRTARDLVSAINPKRTRLILSGDPHQLPSIEPGALARDLIGSQVFSTVELTDVLRQGANSGIVYNANRVLRGDPLSAVNDAGERFTDFFWVDSPDEGATAKRIVEWVSKVIPEKRGFDPVEEIQVVCPGKKAGCGTIAMNDFLQERLNPDGEKRGRFRLGDKVINTKNWRELNISNGDVGVIRDVEGKAGKPGCLWVDFGEGSGPDGSGLVELKGDKLDKIYLANALTAHKTQGSEYKVVLIPIHKCHYMNLYRNLLYTGMTRGRELTTLIGDRKALDIAINTNKAIKRVTGLQPILVEFGRKTAA